MPTCAIKTLVDLYQICEAEGEFLVRKTEVESM